MNKYSLSSSQNEDERSLGYRGREKVTLNTLLSKLQNSFLSAPEDIKHFSECAFRVLKALSVSTLETTRISHCVEKLYYKAFANGDYTDGGPLL